MNVVFRTDASLDMGSGHVMRCLALAESMHDKGAKVQFVCRPLEGNLCNLIQARGFAVDRLSMDDGQETTHESLYPDWQEDAHKTSEILTASGHKPDLLVVDNYGLDNRWEKILRPQVGRILVIDDLANRNHDCDILIDQNLHNEMQDRYLGRVPASARVFVGPHYALLRKEFSGPSLSRERSGRLENLFVYFGGSDPSRHVLKVLQALRILRNDSLITTILLGPAYANDALITAAVEGMKNVCLIGATDNISELMMKADLAIGTCGVAAWERCMLGLPSIVVVTAENQREDANILAAEGAIINLGDAQAVEANDFAEAIASVLSGGEVLKRMGRASLAIMAGRDKAMQELDEVLYSK